MIKRRYTFLRTTTIIDRVSMIAANADEARAERDRQDAERARFLTELPLQKHYERVALCSSVALDELQTHLPFEAIA